MEIRPLSSRNHGDRWTTLMSVPQELEESLMGKKWRHPSCQSVCTGTLVWLPPPQITLWAYSVVMILPQRVIWKVGLSESCAMNLSYLKLHVSKNGLMFTRMGQSIWNHGEERKKKTKQNSSKEEKQQYNDNVFKRVQENRDNCQYFVRCMLKHYLCRN